MHAVAYVRLLIAMYRVFKERCLQFCHCSCRQAQLMTFEPATSVDVTEAGGRGLAWDKGSNK